MKTQYRNVFAEIGIEQAQIKARLEEIRDFYCLYNGVKTLAFRRNL